MKKPLLFLWILFTGPAAWAQAGGAQAATTATIVLPAPTAPAPDRSPEACRALLPTYDAALLANPRDVAALRARALCRLRLRQYLEAADDYTKVVLLRAGAVDDFVYRAEAHQHLRDYKALADDLTNVLRFRPGDITTTMARGLTRMYQNDFPGATRDFTRIIATVAPPSHADSVALAALGADPDAPKARRPVARRPPPRTSGRAARPGAAKPATDSAATSAALPVPTSLPVANTRQLAEAYKYRGVAFIALYEYKRGCEDIHKAAGLLPEDPEMRKDVQRYCPQ